MECNVAFFCMTKEVAEGVVVRQEHGEFRDLKSAKDYGLSNSPENMDGFNICVDGGVRATVYLARAGKINSSI